MDKIIVWMTGIRHFALHVLVFIMEGMLFTQKLKCSHYPLTTTPPPCGIQGRVNFNRTKHFEASQQSGFEPFS